MKVRVVMWGNFPKKNWIDILELIEIGGYVRDFPYAVPSELRTFKIPKQNRSYLEFQRESVLNVARHERVFVWKRMPDGEPFRI